MKRVREKRTRNTRLKFKQRRNVIIAIIIMLCLFAIYGFNRWTKSEILKTTTIKFVEQETGKEIVSEIDVHKEELDGQTKYYIILPERIEGYAINKVVNLKNGVGSNNTNNDENNTNINTNTNTNTNTNVETNTTNTNSNVVEEDFGFGTDSDYTNTSANASNDYTNTVANTKIISEDDIENTIGANVNIQSDDNKNTIVENENIVNLKAENTNTLVEIDEVEGDDSEIELTNTIFDNENTTIDDTSFNHKEEHDKIIIEESKTDAIPGEIIYLSEEEVISDELIYEIQLLSKDRNGKKLYSQELLAETADSNISIDGYIPEGYSLKVNKEDENQIKEMMSGLDEFKNTKVLAAFDITIEGPEGSYQPSEFGEVVEISITSKEKLENNLIINKDIEIIHIKETAEDILFERIELSNKTSDSVSCKADEFSSYAVIEENAITDTSITVNNYAQDFNYYMGVNRTENMVGRSPSNYYNNDNLAKVTINYYGYNPNATVKEISPASMNWTQTDQTTVNNRYRRLTTNVTLVWPSGTYVDRSTSYEWYFYVPEAGRGLLNLTETNNANPNLTAEFTSAAQTILRIRANNWDAWDTADFRTFTTTYIMVFNTTNNVYLNNASELGMDVIATSKVPKGYISGTERQTLMTYIHAVPINNDGSFEVELIDNPFMDRPGGTGFNGWLPLDTSKNTISTDSFNYVQTLKSTQSLNVQNGVKCATINLYVDWAQANVIYYDTSVTDQTAGTMKKPVNSWGKINDLLNSTNRKYATNASSRELNIIVLKTGQLTDLNFGNTVPYTITSIYDGQNYMTNTGNLKPSLYITDNAVLTKDVQVAFVNISGDQNNFSNSHSVTGELSNYVMANTFNLRIGRGLMPDSTNNNAVTFSQVQGGKQNNNTNCRAKFKVVIESGKYASIQAGRTSSRAHTTNITMVIGNDIDRIQEDNTKLYLYGRFATRTGGSAYSPYDNTEPLYDIRVKSGTITRSSYEALARNNQEDRVYAGMYLGGYNSASGDTGERRMTIEGGLIANILGGLGEDDSKDPYTFIYVKGGRILNIVGGAGQSPVDGNRCIQVTDGKIEYSIFGGSNGLYSGSNEGRVNGVSVVYVGGNAEIGAIVPENGDPEDYQIYGAEAGCVFGAGNGNSNSTNGRQGEVWGTRIIIDGKAVIRNSVFGGGNFGPVAGNILEETTGANKPKVEYFEDKTSEFPSTNTYMIANSTLEGGSYVASDGTYIRKGELSYFIDPEIDGKVWKFEAVGNGTYYIKNVLTNKYLNFGFTYVTTTAGPMWDRQQVNTGVTINTTFSDTKEAFRIAKTEGGNIVIGTREISYTTYNIVSQDFWGVDTEVKENFQGSYYLSAYAGTFTKNVANLFLIDYVPTQSDEVIDPDDQLQGNTDISILGGTVMKNVYGGSNRKYVNGDVTIVMDGGTVNGAIYGGTNQNNYINGDVLIRVRGGTLGSVATTDGNRLFGGGKGEPTEIRGNVTIKINDMKDNLDIYGNVFGGSEAGEVQGNSDILFNDTYTSNTITANGIIFGGGMGIQNGATAVNGGNVYVSVDGSNTPNLTVFGGCDKNGTIAGNILVETGANNSTILKTIYGAGRLSPVTADTNSVYVYAYPKTKVVNVFNGGMEAGINGQIPRSVFIDGAEVTESVYGGSYNSGTLAFTEVYCYNGAKIGNVFGAGYGTDANVTGNTKVVITGYSKSNGTGTLVNPKTHILGSVYGGGNEAAVGGLTSIAIDNTTVDKNVYGGGNNAAVTGTTGIGMKKVTAKNVYGGGNAGAVNNNPTITISNDCVLEKVYGGGASAQVRGNSTTTINNSTITTVYGGGEAAAVTGATKVSINSSTITDVFGGGEGENAELGGEIGLKIDESTIKGNVYGGGDAGKSKQDIDIDIDSTTIDYNVYGAGKGGTSDVSGNVDLTIGTETNIAKNVYGGGDQGPLLGNAIITVLEETVITDSLYGGGNNADVNGYSTIRFTDNSTVTNIFGGGNNGNIGSTATMTVQASTVLANAYGGGNNGTVASTSKITVDGSTIGNSVFGAGKGETASVLSSIVYFQNSSTAEYVYGGGDQGEVLQNGAGEGTEVTIDSQSFVKYDVFGGGNGASDGTTKGKVGGDINVTVKDGAIIGDGMQVNEKGEPIVDIYGDIIYNGNLFGGGRGRTALVVGDINVNLIDSTVKYNVYGGGDNGDISGSTNVRVTNGVINGSAFGAGNGIPNDQHIYHIARVSGNSSIIIEGTTQVAKHVFAGGNAAKTGVEYTFNPSSAVPGGSALSIVEISGGNIGKNVYGGANASIVMGNAVVNIGEAAIDEYHGAAQGYIKGDIIIGGEIYGAGEAIKVGNDGYENSEFSVTQTTDINIDGAGYNQENGNVLQFSKNIFGSGNASRPITPGSVTIRNFGTRANPYRIVSIQRAGDVRLDNCSFYLAGTVDTTATFPDIMYSLNMLEKLIIKNNTTLYMRYGANQVKEFWSVTGADDNELLAKVTIPVTITGGDRKIYNGQGLTATDSTGKQYFVIDKIIYENDGGAVGEKVTDVDLVVTDKDNITKNTDNRLYVSSGVNVDIALTEDPGNSDYGNVHGMSFFGIFKEDEGSEIYKGMFDENFDINSTIEWVDRDYNRSYVQGKHKAKHDYIVDGFYTVFEQLQVELDPGVELEEELYTEESISYMDYITPTPEDAAYYMWYAGPESEVYYYNFNLVASKFSTLGTKLLTLDGIEAPNATIKMKTQSSSLLDGVKLVPQSSIPNVNPNEEEANKMLGLAMKTSNVGWAMNGSTDFYSVNNNATREGDEVYILENSSESPTFQFFLYHSNNITKDQELGTYRIEMDISWKKNLTRGGAKIIIDVGIMTAMYDGNYYNAAMTPGRQHELFVTTTTNITTKSSFSAFFEMSEPDFLNNELVKNANYPENAYRQLSTSYQFPVGTTITMLDISDNENPEYYYYIVTQSDVDANKKTFNLTEFKVMGSTDKTYDEESKMQQYIDEDGYQYECFIFTVDFANADFGNITDFVVTENQSFTLTLYGNKVDDEGEIVDGELDALYAVLQDQQLNLTFGIYNTESIIDITKSELSRDTIYPGTNTNLNLEISYNNAGMEEDDEDRVYVHDTRYFDQKMGAKITLYEDKGNGVLEAVPGSTLLGTYFTITQVDSQGEEHDFNYYPRADGTTRIKLADKVSNLSTSITINTEDSTLNDSYLIKIETFGSADGIYFGIDASDEDSVSLTVVDNIYGLNSIIPPNETIVDMTTGHVLEEDTGYVSTTNNKVTSELEYKSGLDKPFITVKLLRRKYNSVNSLEYELVDMKDYVESELEYVDPTDTTVLAREYVALDTATIEATAATEEDAVNNEIPSTFYDFVYEMGEDLVSGTYRVVYSLYDVKDIETVEYDSLGNEISREMKTTYQFIGDTFSYIVIK